MRKLKWPLLLLAAALGTAAGSSANAQSAPEQKQQLAGPAGAAPKTLPYSCDQLDKVPARERCAFVTEQCESDSRIPYTQWYYCHVAPEGRLPSVLFTLLLAVLLPLYFTLLGDTAEMYFSPIMTHISQSIPKMRPRFAGVTFVAMGNGATDLSANISAIRNGDVLLSAGALTGAAMFVQCVVASEVMRLSRGPVKCRGATLRDVGIYCASILMVLAAFAHGRITYWFIVGAVLLYLTYAVWVFVGDEWHERGRPEAGVVWRSFRTSLEGSFLSRWGRRTEEVLPWAMVEAGPGEVGGRDEELTAPLVGAPGEGGGITSRPASPGRAPGTLPRARSHLISAKQYQSMVWADLNPEESELPRRDVTAGGRGARSERQRRHRSGPHRKARSAGPPRAISHVELGSQGGDSHGAATTNVLSGQLGSGDSYGVAAGYQPPTAPGAAANGAATAPPPSGAPPGTTSQLVTLSSSDGSALAAPAPVDAAPTAAASEWGQHANGTTSSGSGSSGGGGGGGGGSTAVRSRSLPDGARSSGRLTSMLSIREGGPWVGTGSEDEEDDYEDSGEDEEERAGLLAGHAGHRHLRHGGRSAVTFEDGTTSESSVSSRGGEGEEEEGGRWSRLWKRIRYELTVGSSAEWEDLPPKSLRRHWRTLTFPILLPVYAALRLTIPFVDPATYSRPWLLATCLGAPLLAAVYLTQGSLVAALIALALGACLAAAVAYLTAGEEDALPDLDFGSGFAFGPAVFAVFGFCMGIIWIGTLASEAVGVVVLLASLLRIPASVMGLTLLAWGNSLGDYFGNAAMARRGQPTMALTACFAGPLFNMLISMALGFASYFARRHVASAEVVLRPEVALGCVFLVLYNAAVAAAGLLNHGSLPERFYVFARLWYAAYFAAACVLGLWTGQGE